MSRSATLADLRAMPPGGERVRVINDYVARLERDRTDALALRNADIRALYREHGWTANATVAAECGMTISAVRNIRGPAASCEGGQL